MMAPSCASRFVRDSSLTCDEESPSGTLFLRVRSTFHHCVWTGVITATKIPFHGKGKYKSCLDSMPETYAYNNPRLRGHRDIFQQNRRRISEYLAPRGFKPIKSNVQLFSNFRLVGVSHEHISKL
eukprot:c9000_g1_i1.p1 GENE.c9000_g1_i1~~c9000_g1_i1.p1  ORF type:complete len:125 (+),score=0.06 c9000_g1_i1:69-443(+)